MTNMGPKSAATNICIIDCDDGYQLCDGRCVNLGNDLAHCEACGSVCSVEHGTANAATVVVPSAPVTTVIGRVTVVAFKGTAALRPIARRFPKSAAQTAQTPVVPARDAIVQRTHLTMRNCAAPTDTVTASAPLTRPVSASNRCASLISPAPRTRIVTSMGNRSRWSARTPTPVPEGGIA